MQYFGLPTMISLGFWLYFILFPQKAYAYLDPGSISYVLQIVVIALGVGVFFIRGFRDKIKYFFTGLFSKKDNKE